MRNSEIRKTAKSIVKRINSEVFNNWLPDTKIVVVKKKGVWDSAMGWYCVNTIYINLPAVLQWFKDNEMRRVIKYRHLFILLAHEMAHQAEDFLDENLGHGKTFRKYARRIKNYYKLPIELKARQALDYKI